jgi:hypothetical protein
MYQGSAYLLRFLRECADVMEYANSDAYHRHISGVVLFSKDNVAHLRDRLARATNVERNLDQLFNYRPEYAFSDHDFYGIAVDHGLFRDVVPVSPHKGLLGW